MFMGDIVGALRRRWILAVICFVLVAAAVVLNLQRSLPSYSYSSTTLLLPPKVSRVVDPSSPDFTHGNPLFFLSSLDQTRDILIGSMSSRDSQEQFAKKFQGASYTVAPDVLGSGPVLVVTTKATTDDQSAAAITALTTAVPSRLTELQAKLGVEDSAMITAKTLTIDKVATVSHKAQIRAAILTLGVLGLIALFFIGVVDALLTARASRRRDGSDDGRDPPAEETGPADREGTGDREPAQGDRDGGRTEDGRTDEGKAARGLQAVKRPAVVGSRPREKRPTSLDEDSSAAETWSTRNRAGSR